MESRLRSLGLALALAAAAASAEDAFPLRSVAFEGNASFTAEQLLPVAGLALGQQVRKADFDAALRRLNETGLFEGLRYRYVPEGGGYGLTIVVTEIAELYPVRFGKFGAVDGELEALLAESLPLYTGLVPGGGPMVRMMVNALHGWWAERDGESQVVADLVPAGDGGFEMLVGPEEETQNIAFVRFSNSGSVDALELQRTFNQAAIGEPYSEARLLELLRYNARPLYTARGLMNVSFCPCEARPDPDSAGLLVEVSVEEGDVYLFGNVQWPEPLPVDPDAVERVNRITPGGVANMKAAYETMAALSERIKRQGYMKAHATFDERVDHEARQVHLEIQIDPGPQYEFSRLLIKGLDILSEPAVRKRWGMQPGDPFDVRYPAYFLDRVKADAMLENLTKTSWSIDVDETKGLVDVTLEFFGMAEEGQ